MDKVNDKLSQRIKRKALDLKRLKQAICASLPLDCHPHIEVSGIRDHQLIILTDSPVWQTRLRMYSQSMLEALHQHLNIRLNQVQIRQYSPQRKIEDPPPTPRILSEHSAHLIAQTANCINDPELQSALIRLSSKAKSPK